MADELQFLDYDGLTQFKNSLNGVDIVTTAGDGNAYTATIPGITELKAGISFTLIPHVSSAKTPPTLDVNDLGAHVIRRRLTNSTTSTVAGTTASWMAANKPIRVMYDGNFWIADLDRPNAADLYGTLGVANGGTGGTTAEGARASLVAQEQHGAVTVSLPASGWVDNQQTVTCEGVSTVDTVLVGYHPESFMEYVKCSVRCTGQGENTLTFACNATPTVDLNANVIILT